MLFPRMAVVTAITVNGANLISKITWAPFGGPTGWLMANGKSYARSYDTDGRVSSYTTGTPGKATLTYDTASRVTKIAGGTALGTRSFVYDAAGQITSASYPNGSATATATYTYDANGNRTKYTDSASATTFTTTLATTSNRIVNVKKPATATFAYDASGNLTSDGTNAYTYNARGRMASVKVGSVTTSYGINGLEQRVSKKGSGVATGAANYVYDEDGQLIGEYDNTGKLVNETVYLGNLPVGILTTAIYTVSPDRLGAPRAAHDAAGKDVWSWAALPYGNTLPVASGLTYNLRFPGQYYDAESKLHYNHHRDYDPALTGRYIQSDPIGLKGGVNTYAYVGNNPVNAIDPKGLDCVSANGTTVCGTLNYLVRFPTPQYADWKDPKQSSPLHHEYDIAVNAGSRALADIRQAIVNDPTPGDDCPATVGGSYNDANPFSAIALAASPVKSYISTNELTGNPVVINVTEKDHPLSPGYVVREVYGTGNGNVAHNYGEGDGIAQSKFNPLAGPMINNQWIGQTRNLLRNIK